MRKFLILLLPFASACADPIAEQLIAHFTFDEGTISAEAANAVSGAPPAVIKTDFKPAGSVEPSRDGVINGAASIVPAAILQCEDPQYGNFPEQSFSVSGWVKADLPPDEKTRLRALIVKGRANQRTPGWAFFLRFDDKVGDIQLGFSATDEKGTGFSIYPRIAGFETGTWYHVAAVVDRQANAVTLYLNGLQLDTHTLGALGNIDSIDPLAFARWPNGSVPFSGMLDDFALWSRPLSTAEVADIYTRGREGKSF